MIKSKNLFLIALFIITAFISTSESLTKLCFGLALFIYAMSVLEQSFSLMAGGILENFLKKATKKDYKSFLFGFISTTVMQSSGLVSVLAISFLSAGLISLMAGICIIYGTNLASATSAWIVGLIGLKMDIAHFSMPIFIFGAVLALFKDEKTKGAGLFIAGVALFFLAIAYMKDGFLNFKSTIELSKYALSGVLGIIVYALIGVFITALLQSSHASITLALTALASSQITYENAVSITIGANLGSTITAIIGSLKVNNEAKKLTITHIIFNLTTAILTILLFNVFLKAVDISADLFGISQDDNILKLAIFQSYFNIFGVLLFYPTRRFMKIFLDRSFTKLNKKVKKTQKIYTAIYLNDEALKFSKSAKEVLIKEHIHLFNNVISIITKSISISSKDITGELSDEEVIAKRDKPMQIDFDELYNERFKNLYSRIIDFSIKASAIDKGEENKFFMDIRRSALIFAEILKDMRNAQPNFYRYMLSQNEFIKKEYNFLRLNLLKSIRIIKQIPESENFETMQKLLTELKLIMQNYNIIEWRDIDTLLYESKISSSMATSLMNDTFLVHSIVKNFIQIVKIAFSHYQERENKTKNLKA